MGSIKELYNNNKKFYNRIAVISLCLIAIGYFSIFMQNGIYFKGNFYKEKVEGEVYKYKLSEDNYFTVNKSDDMYIFTIKSPGEMATIKVEEFEGRYTLYYPENKIYKGEYRDGRFYNEDGGFEANIYFPGVNILNQSFDEKYPKGFVISTIERDGLKFRGNGEGLFLAIISLVMGVLGLKYPKEMEFWGSRWKFKNYEDVELTDEYLSFNKVVSILALIVSFIAFALAIIKT